MICPSPRPAQLIDIRVNSADCLCQNHVGVRVNVQAVLRNADVRILLLHDELEEFIMAEVVGSVVPTRELSGNTDLEQGHQRVR